MEDTPSTEEPEIGREEAIPPPTSEKGPWWKSWATVTVIAIVVIAAGLGGWYFYLRPSAGENAPPATVAFASTTTTSPGEEVEFNAEDSWDIDGTVSEYQWNFGDGSQETGAIVTHAYETHGSYIVSLTITDDRGATANNDLYLVRVQALPQSPVKDTSSSPVAVILTDGNTPGPGDTVQFWATSSWQWTEVAGGDLVGLNNQLEYAWDFDGDGEIDSTDGEPTFVFSDPGVYPAELAVTSTTTGLTSSTVNTIKVLEPKPAYDGTVPNPDVYTHLVTAELSYLDPHRDYSWPGFNNLFENIYEHLWTYDRDDPNTLIPVLAEELPTVANGGVSPDGLTYTIKIREGIPFQCGGELTAHDVEYTLDRLMVMNLPDGPAWEVLEALNTSGTEATGDYTIEFNLWRPYAPFMKMLTFGNFGIMSEDYVVENGGWDPDVPGSTLPYDDGNNATGWGGRNDPFMETHACGTGPYQFVQWDRGLSIELERFDDYWQGPAAIETVIIQLGTEFGPRLLALQQGDADAAYMAGDLQQVDAVRALRADNFRVISGNPTFSETSKIHLNQQINLDGVPSTDNVPADFFQDRDVRLAFNYAVDRQAVVESARSGQAAVSQGPIPPGAFGYNPNVPPYGFDAEEVEEHLRAAEAPDGQSWWDKGFRLTGISISGTPAYTAMLLNLKDNLESINPRITIDVQEFELPAFFNKWVTYSYAIMATTMFPEYADPHTWLGLEATSYGFISGFMGVPDTLDDLVAESLETTDRTERAAIIQQIQLELHELAWYVWVDYTLSLDASAPWLDGYYYHPLRAHPPYYSLTKG